MSYSNVAWLNSGCPIASIFDIRGRSFIMRGGGVEEKVGGYENFRSQFVGVRNFFADFCRGMKMIFIMLWISKEANAHLSLSLERTL